MNNHFNIHKEVGDIKTNSDEKGATPYISISDSSNMQVESSHFSINNKNSTSLINNQQNIANHNNNNNLISTNSDFLSLTKSIINNNINISHNNNNNSGVQISFENLSLSGSNKLQISSNSIIFKKNDTKNSIFLSPSTLCNYYQQSNDVTPYKSPLMKQQEHELLRENEPSSGKDMPKLKQINIDILHKRKNTFGSSSHNNNIINKNININNIGVNSNINNNCEITSRSDECSLDNNKTLSSQRKYLFDKKTPIKYAKNQLKSGEKNISTKSNNSKLENNENNSNPNINIEEEIKNKKKKGISMIQNKNGRNLMDTFEKVGNDDENLKFFNNRRQPTEFYLNSGEYKVNINSNNLEKNDVKSNFNNKFIERLDEDSSFMEKDNIIKTNIEHENEEVNFFEKIKNGLIKEKNEEKNIENNNYMNSANSNIQPNYKNEKIEKKKDDIKKIKENNKEIKENNNSNIPINKEDWRKMCIKKVIPIQKKENNNITELSKNIIKELSRTNLNKRKESRTKSRPSSVTKNIIINFNSFNSIGINNNNNFESIISFKKQKNSNILIKKPKYNNEFKNTADIIDKKNKKVYKSNLESKQTNNTIEPFQIRRKIKIPNRPGKKDKNYKEISICNITNKERKRPPSSENYNRRATSFSNLKQTMNTNLFHNNIISSNKNNNKKSSNGNNYSGQKNTNKNQHQNKKQKPIISNLFVEQDSKQTLKNISHNHPQQQNQNITSDVNNNNTINNYKSNQQENINHKILKKKIKPLINKKEKEKENHNNSNNYMNMNMNVNDRNYQTVSSASRNVLEIKIRKHFNDKKENEEITRKKDIKLNKSLLNKESTNNNNNNFNNNDNKLNLNTNTNAANNNNMQIKQKEEQKVKIIQNFSSYHKIKYKSNITDKINFAETQPKQFCLHGEENTNSNKNNLNNINKNNQKYNNNTHQQSGEANNDVKNRIKHIKFRKLEKLPGDSDSGDVDLNDKF